MDLSRAFNELDRLREDNDPKPLEENKVEDRLDVVLAHLGFTKEHNDRQRHEIGQDQALVPDRLLKLRKDYIIPFDVKRRGELTGPKRNNHLLEKARYAPFLDCKLNPRSGGSGFVVLSDGEKLIFLEVRLAQSFVRHQNFNVRVLLQLEIATPQRKEVEHGQEVLKGTEEVLRIIMPSHKLTEEQISQVQYQAAVTNVVLPRLEPVKLMPFLRFLSRAHYGMNWKRFEKLMNQSLEARLQTFRKECGATAADLGVARAIYSSARFAPEMMSFIIPDLPKLKLPK